MAGRISGLIVGRAADSDSKRSGKNMKIQQDFGRASTYVCRPN